MAIVEIVEPATTNPQLADWVLFIDNIILKTKGLNAASITEGFTSDEPIMERGSSFEVDDSFYYLNNDEAITGWAGIANGEVWIYTNGLSIWYSVTEPAFSYTKYGWYSGTSRALFKLDKGGATNWAYKTKLPTTPERTHALYGDITVRRNMNVESELYANDINITNNINATEYIENNSGTSSITTITVSGAGTMGFTGTATFSGTYTATGVMQSGPHFLSNVWSTSGTAGGDYIDRTYVMGYGFYAVALVQNVSNIKEWLQIRDNGGVWRGNGGRSYGGDILFLFGDNTNYAIYNDGPDYDIYWREFS